MPSVPANPDLLLHRYLWRNRAERWRAQTAESVFTAIAAAAFIGFGLWMADPLWARLLRSDVAWARPLPAALLALMLAAALALRALGQRRALAGSERDDWLAALPIAVALRRDGRRRRIAMASALTSAGIILISAWAAIRVEQAAIALLAALTAGAAIGALASWFLPEGAPAAGALQRLRAVAVAVPPGTRGLALLGAAMEPAVARLPRGAPWMAGFFMLLPPSTPAVAIPGLIVLITALTLAFDLIAHWRTRFLGDQVWLSAQPLPPARLLRAYLPVLAKRATLLALVIGACLHALGAPMLFAWGLALVIWLLLADAVLCAYATRLAPWRFPLLLMLHAAALAASTQVLPPALPIVFGACAWTAWRRGNR
jgi:hypothetical protein